MCYFLLLLEGRDATSLETRETTMEINHLPGTDGVVRFPVERRAKPALPLAAELAPQPDLADAMADERAGGEGAS